MIWTLIAYIVIITIIFFIEHGSINYGLHSNLLNNTPLNILFPLFHISLDHFINNLFGLIFLVITLLVLRKYGIELPSEKFGVIGIFVSSISVAISVYIQYLLLHDDFVVLGSSVVITTFVGIIYSLLFGEHAIIIAGISLIILLIGTLSNMAIFILPIIILFYLAKYVDFKGKRNMIIMYLVFVLSYLIIGDNSISTLLHFVGFVVGIFLSLTLYHNNGQMLIER